MKVTTQKRQTPAAYALTVTIYWPANGQLRA